MASDNKKNILFWILILIGVTAAVYFIAKVLFPEMVTKFTALVVGLVLIVTRVFFRKKRS